MGIEVSVILISHNIYPQNLFTLYSLENQKYDHTQLEVILVDDCSTDDTSLLKKYTGPFNFKYLRSSINLGRAGAKNFGLKEAAGEIVIFLDGEMMVDPYFVANHWRHYHKEEKVIVSGSSSQFSTYSVFHPGFNRSQLRRLYAVIGKPEVLSTVVKGKVPQQYAQNFKGALWYLRKNKKLLPLVSKQQIALQQFKQFSFPAPNFPQVIQKFKEDFTGYHLAWTFFITRNVSVRKNLLASQEAFNEEFKGWGYEDWELGYRLHQAGAKFIEDPEIISYHQEHPVSRKDKRKEQMQNYSKLVNLHPEIDTCALTLAIIGKKRFLEVNDIIKDFYLLREELPKDYAYLRQSFIKLNQSILSLASKGRPITNLLRQAGTEGQLINEEKLLFHLAELRRSGKYSSLLKAFELLIKL